MTQKCKNCGGTLVFDADLQMMVCEQCSAMFPLEKKKSNTVFGSSDFESDNFSDEDLMDIKIYHCSNCGAELMINDVELASFCAYCSQPTIAYSRTEKRRRPQYILPFKIGKNEAITNIREKFVESDYVTEESQYFQPDVLRGIYIPYAMYCYFVHDKTLLRGKPDKHSEFSDPYVYYARKISAKIGHIPVEASYHLSNKSSDQLEPFHGRDLIPFDPAYLSGYYADLCDEDYTMLRTKANARARKIYDKRLVSVPFVTDISVVESNPQIECVKEEYALLPVWFMVYTDEQSGEKYTIMVNGQTGKVVGTLPTSNRKMIWWFILTSIFLIAIICPLAFLASISTYMFVPIAAILIGTPYFTYQAYHNLSRYRHNKKLSTSRKIRGFAKERQKR